MPPRSAATVPAPTPDQHRVADENYKRAQDVSASGNHDYAVQLLMLSCRLDPASFKYRKALRKAQKEKYDNNLRGSRFAFLSMPRLKTAVKSAKSKRDYLRVVESAEAVLTKNPWDLGVQMDQAEAFDALGLSDLAVFTLDQAREKYPKDPTLNRALARLFEKRGDYNQAIILWQMVKAAVPHDVEASHKAKDLAASETIARGGYLEAASGSKESPVMGRLEAAGLASQDKVGREVAPLLKRLEADPTEPTLYVQLAEVYRKHNQPDRARAALQQGLAQTSQHALIATELAELDLIPLREKLLDADTKLKALQAAAAADPEPDAPTADELAAVRHKLHADILHREVNILRSRAELAPAQLALRLELGMKLLKTDQVDEAIGELQSARRDERLKGRASLYLGLCFRKRNNWSLAKRNFEDALQLLPANDEKSRKEALFQLATGSADAHDLAQALEWGNELANLDYNYKNIGRLIDGWQTVIPQNSND